MIQATAATMAKYAGVLMWEEIEERNLIDKVKIVGFVHDEYIVEATLELSEVAKDIVERAMALAGKLFSPTVPTYGDAIVTNVWLK